MRSPLWRTLGTRYKRVLIVLPINAPTDFPAWGFFAQAHGMAINSGYFARVDQERLGEERAVLLRTVTQHRLDPDSLYVFQDRNLWKAVHGRMLETDIAGVLDGFRILAPRLAACRACDLGSLGDLRQERPSLYTLGERISFAKGESGADYAVRGWARPEAWGTWSVGPAALLAFDLGEAPSRDLSLEIEGLPFVNRQHPRQRVELVVNGTPLQSLVYQRPQAFEKRRMMIPRALLSGDGRRVEIELRFPDARSPRELGRSDDDRRLGLGLVSVRLIDQADTDQRRAGS